MLATHGFSVVGVDVNAAVVDTVNNGGIHIEEPGLKTLVQAATKSGNLVVRRKPEKVDAFIIAVPTPLRAEEQRGGGAEESENTRACSSASRHHSAHAPLHKQADLAAVESAAESLVPVLREGNLVILESTVPPTSLKEVVAPILEQSGLRAGKDFYLAHCPERVLPGNILREIIENDRIIGGVTPDSAEMARELYSSFVSGRIFLTDATTAELVKVMENTYRDVNIALANELANVCEELKVDVWEVIELANKHPRVNLLRPGPGVGGHCLSVDPWFVVQKVPQIARLIRLSREINDSQPHFVVSIIEEMVKGIPNPKVTVLGVAYKGNVDDTRESPAIAIIHSLEAKGCQVGIVDPHVKNFDCPIIGTEEAFKDSDCAVLVTDHDEFQALSPEELAPLMRTKQILDTRHFLDLERWKAAGFNVRLLGVGG
jgi:UDP-N-acetyl-D-mannosaminuronic acid dehydrogenase